ncbi:glutathione S-transferase [Protomyces lactucae-debilis]|uniref:Glutathione S-transferase n=1 Tax=Protomyces lactucae-debilis TaxID=2754530 RepID=A0A1Y2FN52_PROLT|nr:glutathione S-transferase [Protomyces lactucae-debilis]ORY85007.1 glutathione S-transferase [Protomyces lactucae-debilis]
MHRAYYQSAFRPHPAQYRHTISRDPRISPFPPEQGRYILYASLLDPWSCCDLIMMTLKGLEGVVDHCITYYNLAGADYGWEFRPDVEGCHADPIFQARYTADIYRYNDPHPSPGARFTVPILVDKKTRRIVNNDSGEIMRIFESAFDSLVPEPFRSRRYYPEHLCTEIDHTNEWVHKYISNGVYKAGFAVQQQVYDEHIFALNFHMDKAEDVLGRSRFLVGDRLTEADVRCFTTMVRYDYVYHGLFKCNYAFLRHDYPNIHRWLQSLYYSNEYPAFRKWTNATHIRAYYNLDGPVLPICPAHIVEPPS